MTIHHDCILCLFFFCTFKSVLILLFIRTNVIDILFQVFFFEIDKRSEVRNVCARCHLLLLLWNSCDYYITHNFANKWRQSLNKYECVGNNWIDFSESIDHIFVSVPYIICWAFVKISDQLVGYTVSFDSQLCSTWICMLILHCMILSMCVKDVIHFANQHSKTCCA